MLLSRKENSNLAPILQKKGNFRKNSEYCAAGPVPTIDSYFFRLTNENLYYTETASDAVVLGAI